MLFRSQSRAEKSPATHTIIIRERQRIETFGGHTHDLPKLNLTPARPKLVRVAPGSTTACPAQSRMGDSRAVAVPLGPRRPAEMNFFSTLHRGYEICWNNTAAGQIPLCRPHNLSASGGSAIPVCLLKFWCWTLGTSEPPGLSAPCHAVIREGGSIPPTTPHSAILLPFLLSWFPDSTVPHSEIPFPDFSFSVVSFRTSLHPFEFQSTAFGVKR